jgi:ADP-ribose pyrophosphatase
MEEKNKAWKTVSSKYLFRRPWLTVRCEDMLLPNGNHIPEYYILEYPDWVNTIAITKEGKFVFVRQYRPGIGRTCYELCAGVCEKEDASPLVSAQRELWEETGYGNGIYVDFRQSEHSHQSDVLLPCNRCGTHRPPTSGSYRRSFRASAHLGRGETAAG